MTAKVELEQLKKLSQSGLESLIIYLFPPSHFRWPVSSNPKAALEAGEVPTDSSQSVCDVYARYPKRKKGCS